MSFPSSSVDCFSISFFPLPTTSFHPATLPTSHNMVRPTLNDGSIIANCADSPQARCCVYPPLPCVCVPCVLLLNHGCADHGLVLIILVLRFYNPQAKNLQNILYLAIIRVDGQCIVAAYGKPEYADTAAQVVNAPAFRTKVSTGQRIRKFYIKKGPTATLVTLQHTNVFCSYCCLSNTLHCTHNQCHAIPPPMPPHIATQCHRRCRHHQRNGAIQGEGSAKLLRVNNFV